MAQTGRMPVAARGTFARASASRWCLSMFWTRSRLAWSHGAYSIPCQLHHPCVEQPDTKVPSSLFLSWISLDWLPFTLVVMCAVLHPHSAPPAKHVAARHLAAGPGPGPADEHPRHPAPGRMDGRLHGVGRAAGGSWVFYFQFLI